MVREALHARLRPSPCPWSGHRRRSPGSSPTSTVARPGRAAGLLRGTRRRRRRPLREPRRRRPFRRSAARVMRADRRGPSATPPSSMLQDLDQQQQHQRREIDPAEVGQHLADRPVERRGEPIERAEEGADAAGAGVEDVEGEQPAEDDLDDDDPAEHAEQEVEDLEEGKQHARRLAALARRGNRRSGREAVGLRLGQDDREVAGRRRPIRRAASSRRRAAAGGRRAGRICGCFRCGWSGPAAKAKSLAGDGEADVARRHQVHFDPRQDVVPARLVAEGVDRDVAVELAVDAVEQVEVEARR